MKKTYIYILERNSVPIYVGKTVNLKSRLYSHQRVKGKDITLIVIDETYRDWRFLEEFWISQFKVWGFELENLNSGGGGAKFYTQDMREKHSLLYTQKVIDSIITPSRNSKISNTLRGSNHSKHYTLEVKDKMSKSQKGIPKPHSKEHKKNLALANLISKGKVVECYTLKGEFVKNFRCLREAKVWLLLKKPNISINVDKQIKDCCTGRQKTCHGYKWKYK